ncbi:MAG: hypothetical protein QM765_23720 [Myxococcales bacterium]
MDSVRVLLACAAVIGIACSGGTTCKDYDLKGGGTTRFLGQYTCTQEPHGSASCIDYYPCSGTATLSVSAEGSRARIWANSCWWGYSEYQGGVCEPTQTAPGEQYFSFSGQFNDTSGSSTVRSSISGQILVRENKTTATATVQVSITPDVGTSCLMTAYLTCQCTNCYY